MSRLKNADSETFSRLRMSPSIVVLRVFIYRRVDILKRQLEPYYWLRYRADFLRKFPAPHARPPMSCAGIILKRQNNDSRHQIKFSNVKNDDIHEMKFSEVSSRSHTHLRNIYGADC